MVREYSLTHSLLITQLDGLAMVSNRVSFVSGTDPNRPTLVAIKGTVFDVSKNAAYAVGGQYHGILFLYYIYIYTTYASINANNWQSTVFAGKDPSRALALSSLKPEECRPEWQDLEDKEKTVLDEWFLFFSKRYNIVGKVHP
jgi:membrane-associated progesterone receptor component